MCATFDVPEAPSKDARLSVDDVSTTCCPNDTPSPSVVSESDDDEVLDTEEEDLTASVPELLDTMNRAAAEANEFERSSAQLRRLFQQRLEHWSRTHEELRAAHGSKQVDLATRVVELEKALKDAAAEVRRSLTSVVQGDELASGLHYARVLAMYEEAHRSLRQLTDRTEASTLRHVVPPMRLLHRRAQRLARDQERLGLLAQGASASKGLYRASLAELERISAAVHAARAARRRRGEAATA